MEMIRVPTGFPVGPVNVYLLETEVGPILVDTGPDIPEARAALLAGLERAGHRLQDLQEVWLTHPHVDHIGLAHWVAEAGATVRASAETAAWLQDWQGSWKSRVEGVKEFLSLCGAPSAVTETTLTTFQRQTTMGRDVEAVLLVDEADCLPAAEVHRMDGHARGHLVFELEGEGDLLLGDHLLMGISSNALVEPPGPDGRWPSMLSVYLESLTRVVACGKRQGFGGHGPIIRDVSDLARRRMRQIEGRGKEVLEQIGQGRTFWDLGTALFPGRGLGEGFLIMSEIAGHVFRQRDLGRLQLTEQNGLWVLEGLRE